MRFAPSLTVGLLPRAPTMQQMKTAQRVCWAIITKLRDAPI